jgi:hypothetical protein
MNQAAHGPGLPHQLVLQQLMRGGYQPLHAALPTPTRGPGQPRVVNPYTRPRPAPSTRKSNKGTKGAPGDETGLPHQSMVLDCHG